MTASKGGGGSSDDNYCDPSSSSTFATAAVDAADANRRDAAVELVHLFHSTTASASASQHGNDSHSHSSSARSSVEDEEESVDDSSVESTTAVHPPSVTPRPYNNQKEKEKFPSPLSSRPASAAERNNKVKKAQKASAGKHPKHRPDGKAISRSGKAEQAPKKKNKTKKEHSEKHRSGGEPRRTPTLIAPAPASPPTTTTTTTAKTTPPPALSPLPEQRNAQDFDRDQQRMRQLQHNQQIQQQQQQLQLQPMALPMLPPPSQQVLPQVAQMPMQMQQMQALPQMLQQVQGPGPAPVGAAPQGYVLVPVQYLQSGGGNGAAVRGGPPQQYQFFEQPSGAVQPWGPAAMAQLGGRPGPGAVNLYQFQQQPNQATQMPLQLQLPSSQMQMPMQMQVPMQMQMSQQMPMQMQMPMQTQMQMQMPMQIQVPTQMQMPMQMQVPLQMQMQTPVPSQITPPPGSVMYQSGVVAAAAAHPSSQLPSSVRTAQPPRGVVGVVPPQQSGLPPLLPSPQSPTTRQPQQQQHAPLVPLVPSLHRTSAPPPPVPVLRGTGGGGSGHGSPGTAVAAVHLPPLARPPIAGSGAFNPTSVVRVDRMSAGPIRAATTKEKIQALQKRVVAIPSVRKPAKAKKVVERDLHERKGDDDGSPSSDREEEGGVDSELSDASEGNASGQGRVGDEIISNTKGVDDDGNILVTDTDILVRVAVAREKRSRFL